MPDHDHVWQLGSRRRLRYRNDGLILGLTFRRVLITPERRLYPNYKEYVLTFETCGLNGESVSRDHYE